MRWQYQVYKRGRGSDSCKGDAAVTAVRGTASTALREGLLRGGERDPLPRPQAARDAHWRAPSRAVQVDSMKPELKAPGTNPLDTKI